MVCTCGHLNRCPDFRGELSTISGSDTEKRKWNQKGYRAYDTIRDIV